MKKISFIMVILFFAIAFISCNKVKQAPELPLEDFFRNPEKTAFSLSPDGKHLVFMAPYKEMMNAYYSVAGEDSAIRLTEETDRSIYFAAWANNNTIIYFKDKGGDENLQIFSVDINSRETKPVFAKEGVRANPLDILEDQPDYILITTNERNPNAFDPYRFNLVTGEMEMLAENPGNIVSWITDHDGKLRMAVASDGVNTSILYRQDENQEFKELMNISFKDEFSPYFFSFDNKKIYAASNIGRDKTAFVLYNPETNEEEEVVFEAKNVDVSGLNYSKKRKVLTSATYYTDKLNRHFFDDKTEKMYKDLEGEFKNYEVSLVSASKEEDIYLAHVKSDKVKGRYYIYNPEQGDVTFLHDVAPWLEEKHMAEMRPVSYESRDGLTIHGYLTVPAGVEEKNLPVVVNPHGGPWARDFWGFNPEIQFLANRGYAVLQMNFRGSTGYGKEFWEKSFKQWGKSMQDDITDGVNWIINQGIADPERIAIYGGSYGGYATLAGLTFTPDLYRCGVDYVGVSNLFTFMNTIPPYWEPMRAMLYEMVGHPVEDSLLLASASPVFHAESIKVPLLIAQGARDPRVNKAESDQMVEALKSRGVEVEYLVKDQEGHGFYNQENRYDLYRGMISFLDKYMKE